jgi:hypothetical protein
MTKSSKLMTPTPDDFDKELICDGFIFPQETSDAYRIVYTRLQAAEKVVEALWMCPTTFVEGNVKALVMTTDLQAALAQYDKQKEEL